MHFTRREHDVLRLLSQGLNNKTMASVLGISPHTVRDHISSMLQRTACVTRTQLAMQHGQPAANAEALQPPTHAGLQV